MNPRRPGVLAIWTPQEEEGDMEPAELRALASRWMADDPDAATREELRALLEASASPAAGMARADLLDRFAASLEFGTAGLRGVIGAGPNRMNRAVVARATWGLARELIATVPDAAARGVIVGGDGRRMSRELAEDAAAILAAHGLRVTLFLEPVPTPLVAFTVKDVRAAAGVVVTASHNPAEYNGYKVYWENGAQIVPPIDGAIAAAIAQAPPAREVVRPPLDELRRRGLVVDAPEAFAARYLAAVRALAVHPRQGDRSLSIVYTPLHGTGDALTRRALAEAGFANVASVPQQQQPDPAFPTAPFPNPEEKGAMDLALALARARHADLVLANDPDADRLAVAIPAGDGYRQLTGNEAGVLIGHYLLTERPPTGPRAVLASIVSSPQLGRIAADLGVQYEETLTGFKWIANRAMALEKTGTEFVFGYEEALGYSVGDVVRDKDGISAAAVVAEIAAVLRGRRQTIQDALDAIARRWGAYASLQVSLTRKGIEGAAAIRAMMDRLRASPPARLLDDPVVSVADYERGVGSLPPSNVLALHLASGARIIARPSGTEPKAKVYVDVAERVDPAEPVPAARARAAARASALSAALLAGYSPP
jgi:phosphomannomutase